VRGRDDPVARRRAVLSDSVVVRLLVHVGVTHQKRSNQAEIGGDI